MASRVTVTLRAEKLRDRLGFLKHKRSAAAHTNRLPATSLSQPQSCKVLTARPTSSSCALSTLMQTHHNTQTQKSYAGTRLPSTTSSGPCVERGVKVARERESLAPPSGTVSFTAAWALATRDRRLHSAREKKREPQPSAPPPDPRLVTQKKRWGADRVFLNRQAVGHMSLTVSAGASSSRPDTDCLSSGTVPW